MRLVFLALLLLLPLAEIAVLVKFGQWAGLWLTLAVVLGTAMLGVAVLRRQGFTMMLRTQEAMMRGEPPVGAMVEGGMMVMAGVLLIMPGLITDALGLLLLLPPIRHFLASRMAAGMFGAGVVHTEVVVDDDTYRPAPRNGRHDGGRGDDGGWPVIEGDFERLDERPVDPRIDPRKPPPGSKS
jgi:UPF0716 protein FxsA